MSKFAIWYRTYSSEITWWVIGWLSWALLDTLARGNYVWALADAGLIYLNYKLWKDKL
jgi:hypothetical protein